MGTGHAQDSQPFTESKLVEPTWTETTLRKPEWNVDIGEAEMRSLEPVIGEVVPTNANIGEAVIQEKAYAGAPALVYSLQTVLSSGDTGLPPAAQQQLTSALLSGDEGKLHAANFKLQQRHPGFAKRLQDQLNALSEE
jgi:hypothetical protein